MGPHFFPFPLCVILSLVNSELLNLIRETKACLMHEFGKGDLFEATVLRVNPAPHTVKMDPPKPVPTYTPPAPIARPKPAPKPQPIEEVKPQEPVLRKALIAPDKDSREMLSLLKEKLPHLELIDPPEGFIDLYFLYEDEELPLYKKIVEALTKAQAHGQCVHVSEITEKMLHSHVKACVASKKLIQNHTALHRFARRKTDGTPMLGNTMLLIAPDVQALETPEVKRTFWNALVQASRA